MLPTNLAKTRAAGRTAYGELVVLSGGPSTSNVGAASSLRYAPYPLPATISGIQHHQHHQQHQHHPHHQTAHIIPIATPAPSILQYTPQLLSSIYTQTPQLLSTSNKRLLATTATGMPAIRAHPHHAAQMPAAQATATPRATATLTYPLTELLGLQTLDARTFFL